MFSKQLLTALVLVCFVPSSLCFNIADWLQNPPYAHGGTVKEQIQCYALPYGGIGFASHCLTYFTVICLASGRSPFRPWKKLEHKGLNIALALVGAFITFPLTVLTMIRCRNTWPFILIAVWKLMLSLTLTTMTVHAARLIREYRQVRQEAGDDAVPLYQAARGEGETNDYKWTASTEYNPMSTTGLYTNSRPVGDDTLKFEKKRFRSIWWWSIPYFLGSIVGFTGVMNLVKNYFAEVAQLRTITYAFGGVICGLTLLGIILFFCVFKADSSSLTSAALGTGAMSFLFLLILMTILFALYTDWALAAMAGELVGVPSSENAVFYWTYFAAKRFPMLSF